MHQHVQNVDNSKNVHSFTVNMRLMIDCHELMYKYNFRKINESHFCNITSMNNNISTTYIPTVQYYDVHGFQCRYLALFLSLCRYFGFI